MNVEVCLCFISIFVVIVVEQTFIEFLLLFLATAFGIYLLITFSLLKREAIHFARQRMKRVISPMVVSQGFFQTLRAKLAPKGHLPLQSSLSSLPQIFCCSLCYCVSGVNARVQICEHLDLQTKSWHPW